MNNADNKRRLGIIISGIAADYDDDRVDVPIVQRHLKGSPVDPVRLSKHEAVDAAIALLSAASRLL